MALIVFSQNASSLIMTAFDHGLQRVPERCLRVHSRHAHTIVTCPRGVTFVLIHVLIGRSDELPNMLMNHMVWLVLVPSDSLPSRQQKTSGRSRIAGTHTFEVALFAHAKLLT